MPLRSPLSSRERVRIALSHQEPDRVPVAMVCSGINPPARQAFDALLRRQRDVTAEAFLAGVLDICGVGPPYVGPPLAPGRDIWGVRRRPVPFGAGSYDEIEEHPLAGARDPGELARHAWPEVSWFDYGSLPARIAAARADGDYCLMVANGNPFETSWYLRGFEQILLDMVAQPELVHALMERVTGFYVEHFARMLRAAGGEVDLAFTADDIAGQQGLLLSLPMWRQFIQRYHRRLNEVIHGFGVRVIYHSDGAVMSAVPGLLEMGIDVLQALQFDARGMDAAVLKAEYGDRLCFEGGVSVQRTLPFGTVADVEQEVRHLVATLGRGGGYVLGPSHAIQAGTPPENVLAMFEAALGEGR
ncbi:MAG: uroporphyrinogen decarboxylase family protein [Candidatus Latescibacterota bacterium]